MKILLIQPPIEDFYTTPIRLYPLGLLYAARVFHHEGFQVKILDCLNPLKKRKIPIPADFAYLKPFFQNNSYLFKGYYRFGITEDEITSEILSFSPDAVGISSLFTAYFRNVEETARIVKSRLNVPVFIGGHHATVFSSEISEKSRFIDHILSGPAEGSAPGFGRYLKGGPDKEGFLPDWTSIAPAHDLLNGSHYRMGKTNYISMIASRGCPVGCDFCSVRAMFGKTIEYREIDAVINEMRLNYNDKNVRIFNFEDDNLSFDRKWFGEFLQAVIKDKILKGIELTAMNGICYPTIDDSALDLMKRAGFRRLNLSLVTKDCTLQKDLGRPGRLPHLEQIIRAAKKLRFLITVYLIIGLPGQTRREIQETIDYLFDQDVLVGPSIFYLPPGSPMYNKLGLSKELTTNWPLYRSSAFAVETTHLTRSDLIELFSEVRKRNLAKKNR